MSQLVLLPGDQVAVLHGVHAPRLSRPEQRSGQAQPVLEQPGSVAGEGCLRFLLVGEGGSTAIAPFDSTEAYNIPWKFV